MSENATTCGERVMVYAYYQAMMQTLESFDRFV